VMLKRFPGNDLARGVSSPADQATRFVSRRLAASPSLQELRADALFDLRFKELLLGDSKLLSCRRRGSDICDWRSS
jgi:hypothetical protein